MKLLVTGAHGTLGTTLCDRVRAAGSEPIAWERGTAPPGDESAARHLIGGVKPGAIIHTAVPSSPTGADNEGWLVNEKWTADMARIASERDIPFVYISSVMVFTSRIQGPFTPDREPDEAEGYGHSKRLGELAALSTGTQARVARIGWQIGHSNTGNNMLAILNAQHAEHGEIRASTRWLPATSFLEDTADAILQVLQSPPGVYHIDGNERWNYHQIVTALKTLHNAPWNVISTDDFVYDQRLLDNRIKVAPIETRLPLH